MKKIITLSLAIIFIVSLSAAALAETVSFSFSLMPPAESISFPAKKADNEQNFYVTTTSHNLRDGDAFWYGPRLNGEPMSTGLKFTNKKAAPQKQPYSKRANPGSTLELRGNSRKSDINSGSLYTIKTSGRWTP